MATDAEIAQDVARRCKIVAAGEVLDAMLQAEILQHIASVRSSLRATGVVWWDDADCPDECRSAFVRVVAARVAPENMTEGEAAFVVAEGQPALAELMRIRQQRAKGVRATAEYF